MQMMVEQELDMCVWVTCDSG